MCVGTNGFWWSLSNLQKIASLWNRDAEVHKEKSEPNTALWEHTLTCWFLVVMERAKEQSSASGLVSVIVCLQSGETQNSSVTGRWGGGYLQAKTTHSVLSSDQMLKWLTVKHSLSVFILKQLCVLDLWQLPSMFLLWTGLHFSCNLSFKLWLWVSPDWMTQSKTQESSGALLLARVGEVKQTS